MVKDPAAVRESRAVLDGKTVTVGVSLECTEKEMEGLGIEGGVEGETLGEALCEETPPRLGVRAEL